MALHHVAPGEKFALHSMTSIGVERTSALVKTDRFEVMQLLLHACDEISGHSVPGYTTLQCLEGAVLLRTEAGVSLNAGDWLYLARGQKHSIRAIEDSALLLTVLCD